MVLDIIEYIGDAMLVQNPIIDSFGANCIKIKSGEIVNFISKDKKDFTPSDIVGVGAYVRLDPTITYREQTNKFTSCAPKLLASIGFRFVVFQVNAIENRLHPVRLEQKITSDLLKINYKQYTGYEQNIKLEVGSSNLDFSANFLEEVGKDYSIGADAVIIAINCTLSWIQSAENCECEVSVSPTNARVVLIKDQDGNTVVAVPCGDEYSVIVASGIKDSGPPYTNNVIDIG